MGTAVLVHAGCGGGRGGRGAPEPAPAARLALVDLLHGHVLFLKETSHLFWRWLAVDLNAAVLNDELESS